MTQCGVAGNWDTGVLLVEGSVLMSREPSKSYLGTPGGLRRPQGPE